MAAASGMPDVSVSVVEYPVSGIDPALAERKGRSIAGDVIRLLLGD
jgi:hypothetical protein